MFKQGKVQVTECTMYSAATRYNEPDGGNNLLNDRPPVTIKATVTAADSDSGIPLRLVVNHLRSLNGIEAPGAGNGDQVRAKRNQQAIYLAKLINGTSGEQSTNWNTADNLVLVGDFNAYHVNDGYVDIAFGGTTRFDKAAFSGDAGFDEAMFSGYARFDVAMFSGLASFAVTDFGSGAIAFRKFRQWGPPAPKSDWDDDLSTTPVTALSAVWDMRCGRPRIAEMICRSVGPSGSGRVGRRVADVADLLEPCQRQ